MGIGRASPGRRALVGQESQPSRISRRRQARRRRWQPAGNFTACRDFTPPVGVFRDRDPV